MSNQSGVYKIAKQEVNLDLTEILKTVLSTMDNEKDKYVLYEALVKISAHQVELVKVLSQVFPALASQMPAFFQQRVDDYTSSLRAEKLLGFRYMSSIKEEAVEKAWHDVERMVTEVSLLKDRLLTGIGYSYREMFRLLGHTLTELALRGDDVGGKMDLKRFGRLLEGKVD